MESALNVQHSRILKRLDPKLYCLLPSVIVPTQSMTNSVSDMGLAVHVPLI